MTPVEQVYGVAFLLVTGIACVAIRHAFKCDKERRDAVGARDRLAGAYETWMLRAARAEALLASVRRSMSPNVRLTDEEAAQVHKILFPEFYRHAEPIAFTIWGRRSDVADILIEETRKQ